MKFLYKVRLEDQVYRILKDHFLKHQFDRDTFYSEAKLAKALNVSRTPIRAALQNLEKERLIVRVPSRGFCVRNFTPAEIEEIFELRKAIEGYVVEILASKKGKSLRKCKKCLQMQRNYADAGDLEHFLKEDRKFHLFLAKEIRNKYLIDVLQGIRDLIELIGLQVILAKAGRDKEIIREHTAIIDAVEKNNVSLARESLYRHFYNAAEMLKKHSSKYNNVGKDSVEIRP